MDLGLAGRAALVTGGASGLGAAIAAELAREGCDVGIVDLRADTGDAARAVEAAGRRAWCRAADVADFALAERVVGEAEAALGPLHLLVCAAGITDDGMSWKLGEDQWDRVLAVNLKGFFNYARAAGARMRARGAGRIVAVSSINGLRGKAGQANYAASKGGMVALAKTLARELGRSGVTVNVIAPGLVRTAMTASLPPEVVQRSLDETVLGHLVEPADCAALVTYLASMRAARVTGQVVRVDAGQYL